MNDRLVRSLRFQGFVAVLVTMLQGFLIAAKVGAPEAQGRAHIEGWLLAFLLIVTSFAAPHFRISERTGQLFRALLLASVWLGMAHTITVATTGATSIHVAAGTASPMVEGILRGVGLLSVVTGLPAILIALYGLRAGPATEPKVSVNPAPPAA